MRAVTQLFSVKPKNAIQGLAHLFERPSVKVGSFCAVRELVFESLEILDDILVIKHYVPQLGPLNCKWIVKQIIVMERWRLVWCWNDRCWIKDGMIAATNWMFMPLIVCPSLRGELEPRGMINCDEKFLIHRPSWRRCFLKICHVSVTLATCVHLLCHALVHPQAEPANLIIGAE